METINSKEYWNELFEQQEQNKTRAQQTKFFVNLALSNLPQWIIEDIQRNEMSIGDIGCAEGIGTEILAHYFKKSKVIGVDFSDQAICVAKEYHPMCDFEVGDICNLEKDYDVIFTSNVLEHFYYSQQVLRSMICHAKKYCIILVPFREYYTVPEHFSYFDFQSFPLNIEEQYELCYFKPINIVGEDVKYWYGEQMLVVYGKKDYVRPLNLTLRNLYNGYVEERTQIIRSYDAKIDDLEMQIKKFEIDENEKETLRSEVFAKENLESQLNELNQKYVNLLECQVENLKDIENYKNEILQKDHQVENYRNEIGNISHTLKSTEQELSEIKSQNATYKIQNSQLVSFKQYSEIALRQGEAVLEDIIVTQKSRSYKIALIARRFVEQCFRRGEILDFIKWCSGKLFNKKNLKTKWLCQFDHLEHAKSELNFLTQFPEDSKIINFNEIEIQKTYGQVFIFASVPYFDVGGGQRSAQLAKTFNNMGYAVYYIYGFPCSEKDIPDMETPVIRHEYIDDIDESWFRQCLKKDALVIFEIPYLKFKPYLDMANKYECHTIYEHIDNWDSSLGNMFYDQDVFNYFLNNAKKITVTAKLLGEKIKQKVDREYLYSANAVNTELFEPTRQYEKPRDLVIGKEKTLLYFGSLWGEWFDWEKIDYIAQQCPDCTINLIGDCSGIPERVKAAAHNVHFLGLKKQTTLPAYLAYSDIALLPFKNCEIGKYVSPLKIFEYIAMNKKVISTPLDDIESYPNVFCSDSKEEWVQEIHKAISIRDSSQFISSNNWYARCNQLLSLFFKPKFINSNISIIVLNYNNLKVIGKCVDSLIAHNKYNYEIIVVDNGSKDGSYEMLKDKYGSKICLLKNSKNGCSSGRNLGVSHAKGDWIVFLDSDQWVISDSWLDCALNILNDQITMGAISWNAGWFEPGKTTGPIVDYLPNRALSDHNFLYRTDIAYLATSGLIMKKKIFEEIGGFDEFYDPTCFEDTDLSLKIRHNGYDIGYSPYMAIMHLPHQTTKSGSSSHTKLMNRNGEYFKNKWEKIDKSLLEYYLK